MISELKPAQLGDEQTFRLSLGPVGVTWRALITRTDPGRLIEDIQLDGPFRSWRHQHRFSSEGEGGRLTDVVAFRLIPTGAGEFVEWLLVRPGIKLMFVWRHWKTRRLLTGASLR
jgi:ligand-binding SRPBCC domain-containing protein